MPKFTLTITADSATEIAAFLGAVPGTATVQIGAAPATATMPVQQDDDNGPVNHAAPAFDSRNMPHDARIHSAAKSTNADGTWRKRKGVSDATIAAVENELKNGMQPATPVQQYAAPVAPVQHYAAPVAPVQHYAAPVAPVQQYAAPQPDPQPQYAQPVASAPAPAPDFATLLRVLQERMQPQNGQAPLVTMEYLTQLCGRIGQSIGRQISNITELNADPQGIAMAIQIMQLDGKW